MGEEEFSSIREEVKKVHFCWKLHTFGIQPWSLMNFHRHIDSFLKKRGLEFEKRNLNRINSTIETNFYARLDFYRTAIDFNHK